MPTQFKQIKHIHVIIQPNPQSIHQISATELGWRDRTTIHEEDLLAEGIDEVGEGGGEVSHPSSYIHAWVRALIDFVDVKGR